MFQFQGQRGNFRQSIKSNKQNKEYFLLELIGQGTEGKVYKGEEITNNGKEFVAIKVQQILNQQNIIYRFAEKKFINLINVREVITNIQGNYIIMDYADGEFYKYMQSDEYKQKSLNEKRDLFIQIVKGVEELHEMKIIHRDLKPENILYIKQQNNGGILLKLCDFGLIKYNVEDAQKTANVGMPYYWAPEIISNQQFAPYTETVDIWALGMIWYEMIVGKPMLIHLQTAQMIKEHLQRRDQNWINEQIDKVMLFPQEKELLKTSILVIDQTKRISAKQFKEKLIEIKIQQNQIKLCPKFQPSSINTYNQLKQQIEELQQQLNNQIQYSQDKEKQLQQENQILKQNILSFQDLLKQFDNQKEQFCQNINASIVQQNLTAMSTKVEFLEKKIKILHSKASTQKLNCQNQVLQLQQKTEQKTLENQETIKKQNQTIQTQQEKINTFQLIINQKEQLLLEILKNKQKLTQTLENHQSIFQKKDLEIINLKEHNNELINLIDEKKKENDLLNQKMLEEQTHTAALNQEINKLIQSCNQEKANLQKYLSGKDQEIANNIEYQNQQKIQYIQEQYQIQNERRQILSQSIKLCQIIIDNQMNRRHNQLQKISNSEDQKNTLQKQFQDEIIKLIDFYKEKTNEINQIDQKSRNQYIDSGQILKYINTVQQILSVVVTKMNEFHFQSKQYKTKSKLNSTKYLKLFIQKEQSFNDLFAQLIQISSDTTNKQYFKQAFSLTQEYHKCFIQAFQSDNYQQLSVQSNQLQQIYQKFKDLINQIDVQQKVEQKNNEVKDEIQQQWESEKQQLFKTLQQLGDGNQALNLILQDFQKVHNELQQQVKSIQDAFGRFQCQEQKVLNEAQPLKQPYSKKVYLSIQYDNLQQILSQEKKLQQISLTLQKLSTLFDQKYIKPLDNQDVKKLINDFSYHMSTVRNPGQIKMISPIQKTTQQAPSTYMNNQYE